MDNIEEFLVEFRKLLINFDATIEISRENQIEVNVDFETVQLGDCADSDNVQTAIDWIRDK